MSATDSQITEIVYNSYCYSDPDTCLERSAYKVEVTRTKRKHSYDEYFSIGFVHSVNDIDVGITCFNDRPEPVVHCYGSGRRGGKNCGYIYPIIWAEGQKVPRPREAC
jgi:hypothetical protein